MRYIAGKASKQISVISRLQLRLWLAGNGALDEAVGVGLGRVDLGILARVLQAFVPAQINFKVVLVGERVVDGLDQRSRLEDLVTHLVHGVLDAGAAVLCERINRDLPRGGVALLELGCDRPDLSQAGEQLPLPTALDLGAQDAVPRLGQLRVLIAVEAVEGRSGALEHEQTFDTGVDRDSLALPCDCLDDSSLLTIAVEGVRVRLAVDGEPSPSMDNDVDVRGVDVAVGVDKVLAEDGSEQFRRRDRVLFGEDVAGLLLGVGSDDHRVVGFGVASNED